jgi:CSLREA domain-containing protein
MMLAASLLAWLSIAPGLLAQGRPPYDPRYDLTGNAVIDGNDAISAASSWSDMALEGGCAAGALGGLDASGDGCLDVADVQLIASHIGGAEARAIGPTLSAGLATWTVNSSGDQPDAAPGDGACRASGGRCTLRAAIQESNNSPGPDRIEFNLRNDDGSCPSLVTISPGSTADSLLSLDDPRDEAITIDGYTQCGARPNSGAVAGNALIKIEIRGRLDRFVHGLRLLSANNVVRGLDLYNWDRQIEVVGDRASHNRIEGNIVGTNVAQTFVSKNLSTHHSEGIRIQLGATYNIVGCGAFDGGKQFIPCSESGAAAARNIVSGNGNDGIHLERNVFYNRIVGNYIGVKQDGQAALKNHSDGVDFEQGPQYNWLGGLTEAERNVISGNGSDGIEISHGTWTQFNHVAGNYFGLDATGSMAVPNGGNGISFEDRVDQNYAYNNYVSGNNQSGFRFYVLATRNEVHNNVVGLAADNQTALPNRHNGVYVMGGSQYNRIRENVIAANNDYGIYLSSTSDSDHNRVGRTYFNTISRNRIFHNRREGIAMSNRKGYEPNQNLAAPTLSGATTTQATGQTCAGCLVELFLADKAKLTRGGSDESGEGMTFVGAGSADAAGNFAVAISGVALGQILTATVTDASGNTSAFARNIAAREGLPEPPTPTASPSPSATVGGPPPSETPTATPTGTRTPGGAPTYRIWLPLAWR